MRKAISCGILSAALITICTTSSAYAEPQNHDHHNHHQSHSNHSAHISNAPIGVMGDHMHPKGGWMLSVRRMYMEMDGNLKNDSSISNGNIVTTQPNRFSSIAGQPATQRIVPQEMSMEMNMIGAMYAPTDGLTLMAMAHWQRKKMDLVTYMGGAGTTVLGEFSTQSEGWGDIKLSSLFSLYNKNGHNAHLNLGLSIPTGSIKETATMLTPMNMTPRMRMPYSMQLGTGTYDLHPGITYNGKKDSWSWGAQYKAEIRLQDENSQNYSWGDKHQLDLWGSYKWHENISSSLRLTGITQSKINGIDPDIIGPVHTADPDNYGGESIDLSLGTSFISNRGVLKGHRLAIEAIIPAYQNVNGVQMEKDWGITVGWQYAF